MREVRKLLGMEQALDIQRQAFLAMTRGRTVAAPNSWLRLPGERRGWLKLLAGYEETDGGLSVKVLARFPDNPTGSNLGSLLLLFDPDNGFPLAIMNGVYVTALRTGAGAGLATHVLAPDATRVGLIGTGIVAWHSLVAMRLTNPKLAELKAFSRSPERRNRFTRRAEAELGFASTAVPSVDEAVADVDVVVTATNAPEPVLFPEHIRPGLHVNAMGIRTEISPEAIARCVVIGDGREEAVEDGKFSVALSAGTVVVDEIGPDLGAVLDGVAVPGDPRERITLFDSSGVAIQDVVCARHVWRQAELLGIGTLVDLGLDDSP